MLQRLLSSQLRRNMASGVAVTVINTVVLAVAYPLYLHFLGYEQYGIWLVLSTVISFAQLGNLGINHAVTKLVAEEYGRADIHAVEEYVSSAMVILTLSGALVVAIVIIFREPLIASFRISEENARTATWLLPYVAVLSAYVFIVQAVNATLSGLGRMDWANCTQMGGRAAAVLISAILLFQGRGIVSLFLGSLFSCVFTHVTNLVLIRRVAHIRFLHVGCVNPQRVRRLLNFGAPMVGGSMVAMLVVPFNRLMLSRYAGIASISLYEIGYQATMQVRGLLESALRALLPEVSRMGADSSEAAKRRIVRLRQRATRLVLIIGLPVYVVLMLFAPVLFRLWLGNQYLPSITSLFRVMAVGGFASLVGVPAFYVLMGSGRVGACFGGFAIPAVFNAVYLAGLAVLFGGLGIESVAYSFVTGATLSSLYLIWQSRQIPASADAVPFPSYGMVSGEGQG